MTVTAQFAEWVSSVRFEDVPASGIETVKCSMLDWIGCALAGSKQRAVRIVNEFVEQDGGAPQARLLLTGFRTTSANAAFGNGVAGHIEDFDDSGNHPASFLTPTVLALGEELHLGGRQVLAAWAVGFEITMRIDAGLRPDRAWHKTAVFGTMGATAAAGKLLGLDAHQTCMALGIAASEAGGVMRNFGTMTKAFHAGNAARSAIVAAKLAARGYTAAENVMEARYGYADCFGGEKCYLPAMTQMLGDISLIAAKGPAIKAWPCCSSNHRPLTGVMNFLARHPISALDIERVEHFGYQLPGTGSLQVTQVCEGLEGKFSMEYNIAAALLDGKVNLATFSDERAGRDDIQSLMKKIHRYQEPEVALHSGRTKAAQDGGRMRIIMKNGITHEFELGARRTLKGDEVTEKFRSNAGTLRASHDVERIIDVVGKFERVGDACELIDIIVGRGAG